MKGLSRRGFLGMLAAAVGVGLTPNYGIDLATGPDYAAWQWHGQRLVAPGGRLTAEDVARVFNVPVDMLGPRS